MAKFFGMIVLLGVIVAGVFGSAATLGVQGGVVQVGSDPNLVCDLDGVEVVSYQMNDHLTPMNVGSVTVTGLNAECDGARLGMRLDNESGTPIAYSKGDPGQWVIAAGTESTVYTFILVGTGGDRTTQIFVPAADIFATHIWMEGSQTP